MKKLTLKRRLLFSFLVLIGISILSFIGLYAIFLKKSGYAEAVRKMYEARFYSLEKNRQIHALLETEVRNASFYENPDNCPSVHSFYSSRNALKRLLIEIKSENPEDVPSLDSIIKAEEHITQYFDSLKEIARQKGFKDFGDEGRMRIYAHKLMEMPSEHLRELALMLRRHEKDFIIRKETQYADKCMALADTMMRYIAAGKNRSEAKELENLIYNYQHYFRKIVSAQVKTGLTEDAGLLGKTKTLRTMLDKSYDRLLSLNKTEEVAYTSIYRKSLIFFVLFLTMASLFSGYFFAYRLSRDAVALKEKISRYTKDRFSFPPEKLNNINVQEINEINYHLDIMSEELASYIYTFRKKVEERTAELHAQTQKLNLKNMEVLRQRDVLTQQKHQLTYQKKLLAEQHDRLTDSLVYAGRIQQALLPSVEDFNAFFSGSFIYYQPKDIVSGDFFWLTHLKNANKNTEPVEIPVTMEEEVFSFSLSSAQTENGIVSGEKIIFAVADCTGHGVPGAFMSIMGHNNITKIVTEQGITKPIDILHQLDIEIAKTFLFRYSDSSSLNEGMEIAICKFDTATLELEYSTAGANIFIVRDGELIDVGRNRSWIGRGQFKSEFSTGIFILEKNDTLYFFSDGYHDQFGGEKNKKFKSANFRDLIRSVSSLPMSDQHHIIEKNFCEWKGQNFQVDDVLVVGIRI